MKKTYLITGITAFVIVVLAFVIIGIARNNRIDQERKITSEEATTVTQTNAKAVNEDADILVSSKMTYTHQVYSVDSKKLTEEDENVPVELLGLNRSEVIEYLDKLTKESGDDEDADSFSSYELTVFSEKRITIRETVRVNTDKYVCFLIAEDGYVNIYTSDRSEIYLDTSLPLSEFGEEYIPQLEEGIYMESDQQLFNFLQNVTS